MGETESSQYMLSVHVGTEIIDMEKATDAIKSYFFEFVPLDDSSCSGKEVEYPSADSSTLFLLRNFRSDDE